MKCRCRSYLACISTRPNIHSLYYNNVFIGHSLTYVNCAHIRPSAFLASANGVRLADRSMPPSPPPPPSLTVLPPAPPWPWHWHQSKHRRRHDRSRPVNRTRKHPTRPGYRPAGRPSHPTASRRRDAALYRPLNRLQSGFFVAGIDDWGGEGRDDGRGGGWWTLEQWSTTRNLVLSQILGDLFIVLSQWTANCLFFAMAKMTDQTLDQWSIKSSRIVKFYEVKYNLPYIKKCYSNLI